jgi:hypothetical protein
MQKEGLFLGVYILLAGLNEKNRGRNWSFKVSISRFKQVPPLSGYVLHD